MERPLTANIRPGEPPLDIDGYERAGGYRAALSGSPVAMCRVGW